MHYVFFIQGIFAQLAKSYQLPPMPQKETSHLGFISDPDKFQEVKMDFPMEAGKFQPTWESIDQNYGEPIAWWRDAKFGIFIHCAPQASGMSGDWHARNLYREETDGYKNHLVDFGHPSATGYKDVLNTWNPADWNAEKLVQRMLQHIR